MDEDTPRLSLPLLSPGQAQKEMFHNEALLRLDAAVQACVEAAAAAPPSSPVAGQCWLVESPAAGAWQGREGEIALWTSAGWRFVAPKPGMAVWNAGLSLPHRFVGGNWVAGELLCSSVRVNGVQVVGERQPPVPSPSGGTTIDAEARAAIAALTAALMSHGLIG